MPAAWLHAGQQPLHPLHLGLGLGQSAPVRRRPRRRHGSPPGAAGTRTCGSTAGGAGRRCTGCHAARDTAATAVRRRRRRRPRRARGPRAARLPAAPVSSTSPNSVPSQHRPQRVHSVSVSMAPGGSGCRGRPGQPVHLVAQDRDGRWRRVLGGPQHQEAVASHAAGAQKIDDVIGAEPLAGESDTHQDSIVASAPHGPDRGGPIMTVVDSLPSPTRVGVPDSRGRGNAARGRAGQGPGAAGRLARGHRARRDVDPGDACCSATSAGLPTRTPPFHRTGSSATSTTWAPTAWRRS